METFTTRDNYLWLVSWLCSYKSSLRPVKLCPWNLSQSFWLVYPNERSSQTLFLQTQETREILHFHYTTWPDFGVPESPASFLNFLFKVRESGSLSPAHGPVVVHCSAGIGRSGTFCLVDTCLLLVRATCRATCSPARAPSGELWCSLKGAGAGAGRGSLWFPVVLLRCFGSVFQGRSHS